jgi:hypothetical protein
MRQTILAIYISIVFHCVIWYPLKGAEWYHFQTNPHGDVQVVIHTLSQRDVNNKIAWGSDPSISLLTMMGISTRWAWRMIMGILQATHLRRARFRGLLLGRPPIQHSYQSSGLETPPSVNERWIRWSPQAVEENICWQDWQELETRTSQSCLWHPKHL